MTIEGCRGTLIAVVLGGLMWLCVCGSLWLTVGG